MKLAKESGEYIPEKDVSEKWLKAVTAAKTKILGVQSDLMPFLIDFVPDRSDRETLRQLIDDKLREALSELSSEHT